MEKRFAPRTQLANATEARPIGRSSLFAIPIRLDRLVVRTSGPNRSPKRPVVSHAWRSFRNREHIFIAALAVAIGIVSRYAAIAFRSFASVIQAAGFGDMTELLATLAGTLPWWQILLTPTVGGLIIGLFVYRFLPGQRNQSVADVIEAAALHGGHMQFKTGIFAAGAAAASIGCGASVGREGPVVHLGATLSSCLAHALHLDRSATRTLLGCGVAAAVAASFNAPIAGVFFALEVVVGHYRMTAFAPVVVASVLGTAISRAHFGDFPAFTVAHINIVSFFEIPAFALLGLVSALVAIIFMASIMFTAETMEKSPLPRWAQPMLGGLAVGTIALVYPQVLGVGYEAADQALNGSLAFEIMVGLLLAKTAATALSLGSGFGGGVFSPSLVVGAMTGGAFGIIAAGVFPGHATPQGAYSIIGMGAVAGAVLGAPISTILIVFELTTSYSLTIAVMIATAISSLVTHQVLGRSFFTWQLRARGIDVSREKETHLLRATRLHEIMSHDVVLVRHDASVASVRDRLRRSSQGAAFVVDENDRLYGTLSFDDLNGDQAHAAKTARAVAQTDFDVLTVDDSLEDAIDVLNTQFADCLPVVDSEKNLRVVGAIHQRDATLAQNRLRLRAHQGR